MTGVQTCALPILEARLQLRLGGPFQRVERPLWDESVAAASELPASLFFSGAELAGKGAHAGVEDSDLTLKEFHSSSCSGAGECVGSARGSPRAASHILGRPGPGEPSGFLAVPGRAEGVARPAAWLLLAWAISRAHL